MGKKMFTDQQIMEALNAGKSMTEAAIILGCAERTLWVRMNNSNELRAILPRYKQRHTGLSRSHRYTLEEMIDALNECRGNITDAAKVVGCTRGTVKHYIERFPEVKEAFYEENQKVTDLARSRLIEAIDDGEAWAIMFYFKYILKLVAGGGPVSYNGEISILGPGVESNGKPVDLSKLTNDELDTLAGIAQRLHGDPAGEG